MSLNFGVIFGGRNCTKRWKIRQKEYALAVPRRVSLTFDHGDIMRCLTFAVALACLSCAKQSDDAAVSEPISESAQLVEPGDQNLSSPTIADPAVRITLTPAAAEQVKKHLDDLSPQHHLRATVKGNGCDGFANNLSIDNEFDPNQDVEFVSHGVRVVVDKRSALLLSGSTIDWVTVGGKPGFSIVNPNAKP